ncbi:DUF2029 domain-containing protein [Hyphobacterium sp. CCMP332]|nr:DUF2029 domain-containing protein [Hyphobacterium sp. CCMP332]
MSLGNKQLKIIASLAFAIPIYIYIGYFLDRTEFANLLFAFSLLFVIYSWQLINRQKLKLNWLIISAITLRLLFLFSEPALSDDVYRYIWDGRLWHAGINPYIYLPEHIINNDIHIDGIDQNLYEQLNSKQYFSIYPPFSQVIFYLSTAFSVDNLWVSIIMIRASILFAEIISFFAILKILDHLKLPEKHFAIYALNPLVIVELSGNLHFEAWLIAFLLLSFLMFLKNRILLSAFFMALSISTKLWPLMFLPLFFGKLKFNVLFRYYGLTLSFVLLSFLPLMNLDLMQNLFQSIDLYFQKFEFNASVFYILRYFGYLWKGYDLVQVIGPLLAFITFLFILFLAIKRRHQAIADLPKEMLFSFSFFLFLSTTVHPWYLCLLLLLSVFTNYRFVILWSFTSILSYYAYSQVAWQENFLLLSIEYILVFTFLILELKYERTFKEKLAKFLP